MKNFLNMTLWKGVTLVGFVALIAAACLTACGDDSSSGLSSNGIITYKSEYSLPDTCSMAMAKVDTVYYACFEDEWIEVTDSATIEQLKEGLDEDEIRVKLEELEDLLAKLSSSSKKATSSSSEDGVLEGLDDGDDDTDDGDGGDDDNGQDGNGDNDGDDDDDDDDGDDNGGDDDDDDSNSSSSEKSEAEGSSSSVKSETEGSSSSVKSETEGSSSSLTSVPESSSSSLTSEPESSSLTSEPESSSSSLTSEPESSSSSLTSEPESSSSSVKVGETCGTTTYDPETQYCAGGTTPMDMPTCGEAQIPYNPETRVCMNGENIMGKCGGHAYDLDTEICAEGNVVKGKCGNSSFFKDTEFCAADEQVYQLCGGKKFMPERGQACNSGTIGYKCGSSFYDQTQNVCVSGVVTPMCSKKSTVILMEATSSLSLVQYIRDYTGNSLPAAVNIVRDAPSVVVDTLTAAAQTIKSNIESSYEAVVILEIDKGGKTYDTSYQTCTDGKVDSYCNGVLFNPAFQSCVNGVIETSECSLYDVTLDVVGTQKLAVVKAVQACIPGLGLKQAKDLVDSAPTIVIEQASQSNAESCLASLEAAGATASATPNCSSN